MRHKTSFPGLILFILFFLPANDLRSQEVDCTVLVNFEAVGTSNRDLLRDFASDLKQYINSSKWTSDNLGERIKCTINVFVQSVVGENRYQARVFVGSQRKIFGSDESSAVIRLVDDSWEFTYIKDRPIIHNPYDYNNLASFLDFYVYLVLGYDYDTYEPLSGTPLFQKAADVASLGRGSGDKGWQPSTGSYSRLQLIDEILNAKYQPVRGASYTYHFTGLDSLAFNPDRAYNNILSAIQAIGKVKREVDPRNQIIRTFFDTKYKEIADKFLNYPDPSVYITFSGIDPNHQKTYEEARAKRQ